MKETERVGPNQVCCECLKLHPPSIVSQKRTSKYHPLSQSIITVHNSTERHNCAHNTAQVPSRQVERIHKNEVDCLLQFELPP